MRIIMKEGDKGGSVGNRREGRRKGGRGAAVWFVKTLAVFTPVFRRFPLHNIIPSNFE